MGLHKAKKIRMKNQNLYKMRNICVSGGPGAKKSLKEYILKSTDACTLKKMKIHPTVNQLIKWFDTKKRDLPWRAEPRIPYRVWISEIMLQQSQVHTVIGYYHRWINRFPDLRDLATATLDEVLKTWEGLGYYCRARNLYKSAQILMERYEGHIPEKSRELSKLPGIGPYTAAAIASLCFGEQIVTVDGNVRRIIARVFAIDKVIGRKDVERLLAPFYIGQPAGRLNEALMELGALCCKPAQPLCSDCPIRHICLAWKRGSVEQFPATAKRKHIPHLKRFGYLVLQGNTIFLRKRPLNEMLGGLWGIPLSEEEPPSPFDAEQAILPEVRHTYTHFRITVQPIVIKPSKMKNRSILKMGKFIPLEEVPSLALSGLDHKILSTLETYLKGFPWENSQLDSEKEER